MQLYNFFPLVSFLLFILLIVRKIIILKKKGVPVSSKAKKGSFIKYLLYPIFLLILVLFIFELIRPALNITNSVLPQFFVTPLLNIFLLKVLGTIITIGSLIFFALTLQNFNKSLRFGMDSENLGGLITNGVFSISRNPFFISIILYFKGIALIYLSPFFIIFAALTMVSIHSFILKEEKFLQKNYGSEYEEYAKNVRRYF